MNFTFGSNPSFIPSTAGQPISPTGILPSKNQALEFLGNAFYRDDKFLKIAFKPVYASYELFKNTELSLKYLSDLIAPVQIFDATFISGEKKASQEKISIYDHCYLTDIYGIDYEQDTTKCYAKGPIHLGSDVLFEELNSCITIMMLDLFVAIPALYLDNSEADCKTICSNAGAYHFPNYGIEYSVLTNFWFKKTNLTILIYDLCKFVLEFVEKREFERFWLVSPEFFDSDQPQNAFKCIGYDVKKLTDCINNRDKQEAEKFMYFISNFLPEHLCKEILNQKRLLTENV